MREVNYSFGGIHFHFQGAVLASLVQCQSDLIPTF